jgi:hypothetical protein
MHILVTAGDSSRPSNSILLEEETIMEQPLARKDITNGYAYGYGYGICWRLTCLTGMSTSSLIMSHLWFVFLVESLLFFFISEIFSKMNFSKAYFSLIVYTLTC